MPKQTYFNLNDEKQNKIYETLVRCFKEKTMKEVTVKEIVLDLEIPRGSFYQYFESINEAYFFVLDQELIEIYESFLNLVRENDMNVMKAIEQFGEVVADEIFTEKNYNLYRNRYIGLDVELERQWKLYRNNTMKYGQDIMSIAEKEKMTFIGGIMHSLVQRLFTESWDRGAFLHHYEIYMHWIKRGIEE